MDIDDEVGKFKHLMVAGVVFLVSGYIAFSELRYAIWSKTAEATVTKTHETASTGRRRTPLLAVYYSFSEADGTGRSERDDVPVDFPVDPNGKIQVQYLPGVTDSSRLVGHSGMGAVYLFLGCCVWLAIAGFQAWREIKAAMDGPRRRRR